MARNEEKAMSMLSRFRAGQAGEKKKERRPFQASLVSTVRECEKWRTQIIRVISKKVAQIQNAGLGEFKIRDINDEINRLLREKWHWERRCAELGGPDYSRIGARMVDFDGREVPGADGYKYFGAAKQLPGVRELFEESAPKAKRKTRGELNKLIDVNYYGYRDDDDGVLASEEEVIERNARRLLAQGFVAPQTADKDDDDVYGTIGALTGDGLVSGTDYGYDMLGEEAEEAEAEAEGEGEEGAEPMDVDASTAGAGLVAHPKFTAHVPVPSKEEMEKALMNRRKEELLKRYASDAQVSSELQAKQLLGK